MAEKETDGISSADDVACNDENGRGILLLLLLAFTRDSDFPNWLRSSYGRDILLTQADPVSINLFDGCELIVLML